MLRSVVLIMLSLQSFACAHITFESVDTWNKPWYERWFAQSDGIRYYRPKPYLLVTETVTEKTGGAPGGGTASESCVAEVKYLPDYSREYVMIPHYWLGSVAMKPTLADGWNLTNFDSTVDTKIPETINALAALSKSVAPNGIAPLTALETLKGESLIEEQKNPSLSPGLYEIVQSHGDGLALDTNSPVFYAPGKICKTLTAPPAK